VTILRARDEFWDSTARAEALLREARRIDLTSAHTQVFEAGSDEVVRLTREFLDR
jgi:hypothetical protein